uniref:Uncharacterized protein n=1 Tax=Anopheles arabiensis TaxID=7173 RepID=A0A182IHI5_ANOAR
MVGLSQWVARNAAQSARNCRGVCSLSAVWKHREQRKANSFP